MAELSWKLTSLVLLLNYFPGSLCDNYTTGGLVASSIFSCLLFIVVLIMLVMVITWNEWFPKCQRWRGKVKLPREKKVKIDKVLSQLSSVSHEPIVTTVKPSPRGGSQASSQRGTFSKYQTNGTITNAVYNPSSADSWIQEIPTPRYEEKAKEIQFDDEDEDEVIVTEVVQDKNTTTIPLSNGLNHTVIEPSTSAQNSQEQTNVSQSKKSPEIEMTLERQSFPGHNITEGVMNFGLQDDDDDDDDEAVANLSASRKPQGQREDDMVLY